MGDQKIKKNIRLKKHISLTKKDPFLTREDVTCYQANPARKVFYINTQAFVHQIPPQHIPGYNLSQFGYITPNWLKFMLNTDQETAENSCAFLKKKGFIDSKGRLLLTVAPFDDDCLDPEISPPAPTLCDPAIFSTIRQFFGNNADTIRDALFVAIVQYENYRRILDGESIGGNAGASQARVNACCTENGALFCFGNFQYYPENIQKKLDKTLFRISYTVGIEFNLSNNTEPDLKDKITRQTPHHKTPQEAGPVLNKTMAQLETIQST